MGILLQWLWDTRSTWFGRGTCLMLMLASPDAVQSLLDEALAENNWPKNPRAQICRLYIIGKGKHLAQGQWLWRTIAAYPHPQIDKQYLRTAARAYSLFLQYLIDEIPCSFQILHVNGAAQWYSTMNRYGITDTYELDCKDHTNKVQPQWINKHMAEASGWLM